MRVQEQIRGLPFSPSKRRRRPLSLSASISERGRQCFLSKSLKASSARSCTDRPSFRESSSSARHVSTFSSIRCDNVRLPGAPGFSGAGALVAPIPTPMTKSPRGTPALACRLQLIRDRVEPGTEVASKHHRPTELGCWIRRSNEITHRVAFRFLKAWKAPPGRLRPSALA